MDYRVIKENDLFLMTDLSGDIPASQSLGQGFGLYTKDTRFLSVLELRINGEKPIVLSSEADENYLAEILLTNPHMEQDGKLQLWRESIELKRTQFIYEGVLYESIQATNYSPQPNAFELSLRFSADFTDMFVIRGFQHGGLGRALEPVGSTDRMTFGYEGADDILRRLVVQWNEPADRIDPSGECAFRLRLAAGEAREIAFVFAPVFGSDEPVFHPREEAVKRLEASYAKWAAEATSADSDLPAFNNLYQRGLQDIRVLLTDLGDGIFPVAGLPWFAVPFGRDSLITALQLLPIQSEAAKGTLLTMARFQGTQVDPWRDEQPGKMMHELRSGELANTNQVPFGPYYGSIDSTPLFLLLLGEYVKWTNDTDTLLQLMPNVRQALDWITHYGQREGGVFTSYYQESSKGIANQGWKDSGDSIVHRNGEFAKAPVALVEVQGYIYQAKKTLAALFGTMEDPQLTQLAVQLTAEAEALRLQFEEAFWMEEHQYYAIALDHEDKQVGTITSNPGHVLMSGMLAPDRAAAVARKLVSPEMFSGFGIRTMAEYEIAYNPMSYHNGSIWPHDNSMCLMGLGTLGFQEEARIVMEGLLEASAHFDNSRLPELFCGYSASRGRAVRYPVACSPQAWAAATPLVFLSVMLGLRLDVQNRRIEIHPNLPAGMNRLSIQGMRLGGGSLDIEVRREAGAFQWHAENRGTGWQLMNESSAARV